MRSLLFVFTTLVLNCGASVVWAELIQGPPLKADGSIGVGHSWGLQFNVNQDTYLLGFRFSHYSQTQSGTISLIDVSKTSTVDTWSVSSTPITYFFHANDLLRSGDTYQLIYAQQSGLYTDEKFAYIGFGTNPPGYFSSGSYYYSNPDITVTHGVEDTILSNSSGYAQWYAFNSLFTSQTVPEPSCLSLLSLGGLSFAIGAIWRRRQAESV